MSVVAVAGGTGKLGRAIVDAIISEGKHDVLVLSRQIDDGKEKEIGTRIVAVDYDDVDAITALLKANNVKILISALTTTTGAEPELNLIKAAEKSTVVKRYMPSMFGVKYTQEMSRSFPIAKSKLDIVQAVESSSLDYTVVINGYFLDFFVAPKVKSYMPVMPVVIDIANNFAAIPGSGNVPVVFTHTFDIARFVSAALSLPRWEKESYIIGDKVTWNEFLQIAEEVKGAKFTVEHDSIDKLRSGQITELPAHTSMYQFSPKAILQGYFAAFGIMFDEGVFDFTPSHTWNEQFPEIHPRTVKELVVEAWKGA